MSGTNVAQIEGDIANTTSVNRLKSKFLIFYCISFIYVSRFLRGVLLNYRSRAVTKEFLKMVFGGKLFWSVRQCLTVNFW